MRKNATSSSLLSWLLGYVSRTPRALAEREAASLGDQAPYMMAHRPHRFITVECDAPPPAPPKDTAAEPAASETTPEAPPVLARAAQGRT